ncbi:MAG: allophanate hydrolase [Candidatus Pelagisphaera sp.]|jgi:allophanate hydrolase
MNLTELSFDTATLSEGYSNNAFSISEIIRESLRRIKEGDSKIWISVDTEANLIKQAEALEKTDPNALPLYGIPFAVKDNIDVANLPTTAACPDYKYFPQNDASVISQLRTAGAIPIGKTNLDQFATGLVGVRSPYGIPGNAFDPEYIPGGSSAGSAVSVALGQVSFSLGTDTAGSGRVPACFNNLVGLKPSRGLLSSTGVIPACRSLDCVSIFSLNSGDAQTILRAAAHFDPSDPYSRRAPNPAPRSGAPLTFGVPEPTQLKFFGNDSYMEAYLEAIERLESLGYQKQVVDFAPFLEAARLLYEGPWVAERYWAIQDIMEKAPEILHPTTRAIIENGRNYSSIDTFDAIYKLQALKLRADAAMQEIDFLATPTVGTHYTIAEVIDDPITLNSNLGYYTNFMNLLDLSAIATPTTKLENGMPFGITLAAPAFQDEFLLTIADRLHQASDLTLGASNVKRHHNIKHYGPKTRPIVVCGAHMSGLPLNHQLTELGATFQKRCSTAPNYRLFALPNTVPPKPGMIRDNSNGVAIEVEVWDLPISQWGAFVDQVPNPLGIATVELDDGTHAKGFICEHWAIEGAKEVSQFGSWRAYVKTL